MYSSSLSIPLSSSPFHFCFDGEMAKDECVT